MTTMPRAWRTWHVAGVRVAGRAAVVTGISRTGAAARFLHHLAIVARLLRERQTDLIGL